MNHELGSVCPHHDDNLKKPSGSIGPQVQGLIRVLTIVGGKESMCYGVADVVIVKSVAGLMLPR
jgi:hypothetical protein